MIIIIIIIITIMIKIIIIIYNISIGNWLDWLDAFFRLDFRNISEIVQKAVYARFLLR